MPRISPNVIGNKYGPYLQLEIVEKLAKDQKYKVRCSICAHDPELYGEAYFSSTLNHLKNGVLPCGCSTRPTLTPQQHVVRCKRKCAQNDLEFLDFSGEWLGIDTKVKVRCQKDGHEWLISIDNLMRDKGCPKCRANKVSHNFKKNDEILISKFISTGSFKEGSTFQRSNREDNRGYKLWWDITCPLCSTDEYVSNGLCTGVFNISHNSLNAGHKPCRCSKAYRWTREQREYQIAKRFKGTTISFVRWIKDNRVELLCSEHGKWSVNVASLLNNESTCSGCCVSGFKRTEPASIYVIKVLGSSEFTGYGISGQVEKRLSDHRRNLLKSSCVIDDMEIFHTEGWIAQEVERLVKLNFDKFSQNIEGFKTEATYDYSYLDVVAFVDYQINLMEELVHA